MPSTQFPKVVAFVEGTMEKLFVNRNFHYVRLIPVDNGITWTIDAIATRIVNSYRVLNLECDFVVVWIDRENRTETSIEISNEIRERLLAEGISDDKLAIMICDRTTENIILADEKLIRDKFDDMDYNYNIEGNSGKSMLKRLFRDRGQKYSETSDGVKLLKSVRLENSAQKSVCAQSFLNQLGLDCWWIETNSNQNT